MLKAKYGTAELAKILGQTRQNVWERANYESWPISKLSNRQGGHSYAYADLPGDIQRAVLAHTGPLRPPRPRPGKWPRPFSWP